MVLVGVVLVVDVVLVVGMVVVGMVISPYIFDETFAGQRGVLGSGGR